MILPIKAPFLLWGFPSLTRLHVPFFNFTATASCHYEKKSEIRIELREDICCRDTQTACVATNLSQTRGKLIDLDSEKRVPRQVLPQHCGHATRFASPQLCRPPRMHHPVAPWPTGHRRVPLEFHGQAAQQCPNFFLYGFDMF